MTIDPDARAMRDPEAQLEDRLIEQYLRSKGFERAELAAMPEEQARRLMREASAYAAAKLAEVEARAHFVHDLHRHE
jgi:hypothetical protein